MVWIDGSKRAFSTGMFLGVVIFATVWGANAQTKPVAGSAVTAPVVPTAGDKQKAAHADADRLLTLAQELKNTVEKSRKDELNVQVIREAEEIEKLARSLRSRVQ